MASVISSPETDTSQQLGLSARDLHDLQVLLKKLIWHQVHEPVRELALRVLQSGGKRLRPLLVLLVGGSLEAPREHALVAAAAAELIHTASLVHDDILDRAKVRRGQDTINWLAGNHTAVLVGDMLFATAFSTLAKFRLYSVLDAMAEAVAAMCEGEINQARHKFDLGITIEQYLETIDQKTSALVCASCQAGGLVTGARPEIIESLAGFGRHLGTAFQVMDDVNDFLGNPTPLGKPTWSDLAGGTLTLPVIYALTDRDYGQQLQELIFSHSKKPSRPLDEASRLFILEILQKSGALQRAITFAHHHQHMAQQLLMQYLPASPQRDALLDLLSKIVPGEL